MEEELKESRIKRMIMAVVALLLVGAVLLAAMQTMIGRAYRTRLQSVVEQNYYELLEEMEGIEISLGKLSVADGAQQNELLNEIQRKAGNAARHLAQMGMEEESLQAAMQFVNRLADYAGALQRGVVKEKALSKQDAEQLSLLRQRCKELNTVLLNADAPQVTLRTVMLNHTAQNATHESYIQLAQPEEPLPALLYDGAYSQAAKTPPKVLGTREVSWEEALALAKVFVGEERVISATQENGLDGEIPCWGVAVETHEDGLLHLQITRMGGQVLMMAAEHPAAGHEYAVQECRQIAQEFLGQHGYDKMETAYYAEDIGTVTFSFVPVQDGVRLYPDLVKVQVSAATGNVVGLEANNYLRNHVHREFAQEILSEEEIRALTNDVEIESICLAVIPVRTQEIYCWEVRGYHEGEEYLIYLEAETGVVQDILQVVRTQDGEAVI